MGVNSYITDESTGNSSNVESNRLTERLPGETESNPRSDRIAGVVALTMPAIQTAPIRISFTNDTYGSNMAVDGSPSGGATENIHNGLDNVYWTGTGPNYIFDSTAQAHTGTRSIDATNTTNGDTALFTAPSPVTMSSYGTLLIWIYVTSWPTAGNKEITVEFRSSGTLVGNSVNLSSYVDKSLFDVWQLAAIPLTDMGITVESINELAITVVATGGGQPTNFYLDDISLVASAGGVGQLIYSIEPEDDEIYYVESVRMAFADALADLSGSASLSYDKLLGVSALDTGLVIRRRQANEVVASFTVRKLFDMLTLPESVLGSGTDGTNTWLTVDLNYGREGAKLLGSTRDGMDVIVSDDLSGLLAFETSAQVHLLHVDPSSDEKGKPRSNPRTG